MSKTKRGRPPLYLHKISAMKRGAQLYLSEASPNSVKAIASRAGKVLERRFSTRPEDGGVWVYREV